MRVVRSLAIVAIAVSILTGAPARAAAPSKLTAEPNLHGWVAEPERGLAGWEYPGWRPSATLTDTRGAPLAGRSITFTQRPPTGGEVVLCSAVTDAHGIASCEADASLGYGASFAGDDLYAPSSASGYTACITSSLFYACALGEGGTLDAAVH